ncbi:MAG: response regulator transcription factor [Dehalococcoidales bacterium]|nr:response regulator transcription factor [Dehalococcoidales bacterium]
MKPLRVLIVDDNFVARRGLRSVLEAENNIIIAGESSSGAQAISQVSKTEVDLILMDIRMPEMDGIQAIMKMPKTDSQVKILMLTVVDDPLVLANALKAGASGYLVYGHFSPDGLIQAIKAVSEGKKVTVPPLASFFPQHSSSRPEQTTLALNTLTPRENEVLNLIAAGKENREIAQNLLIEEKTVKNHINSIYSKLGVSSRSEAIAQVINRGFTNR